MTKKSQRLLALATTPTVEDSATVALLKEENKRLRHRLTSVGAAGDLIVQAVEECFASYNAPSVPRPSKSRASRETEEAVLHVSDVQYGKITASYDSTVATERLADLSRRVATCIERHRSYARVDTLHIYLGGDIVEGELIFPHQPHLIDQSVFDQAVRGAPEACARLVLDLAQVVENVHVVAVAGNHGRPAGKHAGSNPRTNWDSVCYDVARLIALGPKGRESILAKRVKWENAERFYAVNKVAGWTHLLVHGHQISGWAGIPFYGINRKAAKWSMSIPRALRSAGLPDAGWDALYMGHFHTYTSGFVVDRPWFVNGTVESDNDFALEEMGEAGSPVQRLQFWRKDMGLVADRPIYLDRGNTVPAGPVRAPHGKRSKKRRAA